MQYFKYTLLCTFLLVVSQLSGFTQQSNKFVVSGDIADIYGEPLDSVSIIVSYNGFQKVYKSQKGAYTFTINLGYEQSNILIEYNKPGYRPFETEINIDGKESENIDIRLFPGYKILLKGRVRVGNMPLENVNVIIKHDNKVYTMQTLDCFIDDEEFWNCLYLGMFKAEISSENPNDSVTVFFTKPGYKPLKYSMLFSEYSGEQLDFKLEYADVIPDFPVNNVNLKIAPPLGLLYPVTDRKGWFISMSYYKHFNNSNLSRFSAGVELNLVTSEYSVEYEVLPNTELATADSIFINGMIGPSVLFWLIKPDVRSFSTYIGNTLGYSFVNNTFSYQPFIGTRYFLDLNKSISVEFRYLKQDANIGKFASNQIGDAITTIETVSEEKFIINLGVQICF